MKEPASWIGGGLDNRVEAVRASVTAGENNDASGDESSVSGGYGNKAEAPWASILGGNSITLNTTNGIYPE
ncbi:MAG: hypothetical protein ABSG93_13080 [Solirubrobacteraceae bacterium]|jgi:hypothetical protein